MYLDFQSVVSICSVDYPKAVIYIQNIYSHLYIILLFNRRQTSPKGFQCLRSVSIYIHSYHFVYVFYTITMLYILIELCIAVYCLIYCGKLIQFNSTDSSQVVLTDPHPKPPKITPSLG